MICYFAYFSLLAAPSARISAPDLERVAEVVDAIPGLVKGLVHTPTGSDTPHPFANDGPAPALALQLYFDGVEALEAAARSDGHLQDLARAGALPSLDGAIVTQQAMIVRRFPVDDPVFATPPAERACSHLVHYPGAADDLNAWHAHYIDHHPVIMRRFPGVRQIEIYTRLDWCGCLPWPRVDYMQRNKLVFDTPAALSTALFSAVFQDMRADFHVFPTFTGGNVHFPMQTLVIQPRGTARR